MKREGSRKSENIRRGKRNLEDPGGARKFLEKPGTFWRIPVRSRDNWRVGDDSQQFARFGLVDLKCRDLRSNSSNCGKSIYLS